MNDVFLFDFYKNPYMLLRDGKVIKVSQAFMEFTGYSSEEMINKNISEVFRILQIVVDAKDKNMDCSEIFLVTRAYEMRFANLFYCRYLDDELYSLSEVPDSRIEGKFPAIEALYDYDSTGVAIFNFPDAILLRANNAFVNCFDEPYNKVEHCIGKTLDEFVAGYKGSDLESICNRSMTSGEPCYIDELKHEGLKRGEIYWNFTITPIVKDKMVKYFIMTTNDVTEKVINKNKIYDQARIIEQQKKQFEVVFENMADGCIIFNMDKEVINMNKAAREWFPMLNWKNIYDLGPDINFYDLDRKKLEIENLTSAKILQGFKMELREILIRGENYERYLNVSGTPIYDENGIIVMGVLNIQDISEQIKYKRALKIQNDYLFKIIDVLNLPIIRVSYPELEIVGVNIKGYEFIIRAAGENIKNLDDMTGKNIYKINSDIKLSVFSKSISKMVKSTNSVILKDIKVTFGREIFYYNFILQPVSGAGEDLHEFMMVCVDITDEVLQKQAVEEVMRLQEEFFTYITHEFKTPLTSMSSTIQFMELLHSNEMNENITKNIGRLKRNVYQQLRLVNNLLDIIKAESGYLKVYKSNLDIVHLTRSIAESINEFARAKGIKVNFSFLINNKIIAIDDEKYERILLNLLSNAIKYTPKGKSITIGITDDDRMVHISVKDEGPGIPRDKYDIIFERFGQVGSDLTRYSEGTGIGLCLVRLLVKALDGKITFKSIEGKGTTFTVSLPNMIADEDEVARLPELTEGRLIRTMNVEFSNIYLD